MTNVLVESSENASLEERLTLREVCRSKFSVPPNISDLELQFDIKIHLEMLYLALSYEGRRIEDDIYRNHIHVFNQNLKKVSEINLSLGFETSCIALEDRDIYVGDVTRKEVRMKNSKGVITKVKLDDEVHYFPERIEIVNGLKYILWKSHEGRKLLDGDGNEVIPEGITVRAMDSDGVNLYLMLKVEEKQYQIFKYNPRDCSLMELCKASVELPLQDFAYNPASRNIFGVTRAGRVGVILDGVFKEARVESLEGEQLFVEPPLSRYASIKRPRIRCDKQGDIYLAIAGEPLRKLRIV